MRGKNQYFICIENIYYNLTKLCFFGMYIVKLLRVDPPNKGGCNMGAESAKLLVHFGLFSDWNYASHTIDNTIISNGLPNLCVGMFRSMDTYILHNQ